MKKLLSLLIVLSMLSVCLVGCRDSKETDEAVLADPALSEGLPLYESLDRKEREIYLTICGAIESFNSGEILIGSYDNENDRDETMLWVRNIYLRLLYDHPEYFWVNPYDFELVTRDSEYNYKLYIKASFLLDEAKTEKLKVEFDKKVDEIVSEAEKQETDYEKVKFVYDYIIANTVYDKELAEFGYSMDMGRSIYGCLVEGETVCSGYSLAFILILNRLGIECGAEFQKYGITNAFSSHVWNYCKLDGEYYYFDLTWEDTTFDTDEYRDYITSSYCYFGVTRDEIARSREITIDAQTPECNATAYNYYIRNGMNFAVYEREAVCKEILRQKDNEYITVRFDSSEELERAVEDLMTNGYIFEIISGHNEITYVRSSAELHLFIILK